MLSEAMWGRLAPSLPPQRSWTGRPAIDHRRSLEAVLWLARTGAPWRDLPPELMNWRTAWRRLQRWTASGVLDRIRSTADDGAGGGLGGAHARQHRHPRPHLRRWGDARQGVSRAGGAV